MAFVRSLRLLNSTPFWIHPANRKNVVRQFGHLFEGNSNGEKEEFQNIIKKNRNISGINITTFVEDIKKISPYAFHQFENQQYHIERGCKLRKYADDKIDGSDTALQDFIEINSSIDFTNAFTKAEIYKLVIDYRITSEEWLLTLLHRGEPFQMGILEFDVTQNPRTLSDVKKILNSCRYSKYIDYHNGVAIKQSFSGFIDDDKIVNATLNLKSYDDRNRVPLLQRFTELIVAKKILKEKRPVYHDLLSLIGL